MIKKVVWVGLTVSLLGFMSAATVHADEWNKKTVLTFSQPVELPGHVLPAGTYIFMLADTLGDRHVVQVFNADGSQIIATLLTIPDYRLATSDQTVLIKFREVPRGAPEAIRAWFYPGNSVGQEFVYPKSRAIQLAKAEKTAVPAVAAETEDVAALKAAPIVAITPDEQEVPVTAAIQTTPVETTPVKTTAVEPTRVEPTPVDTAATATVPNSSSSVAGTTGIMQTDSTDARRLPHTASAWPLFVLFGLGSIGVAFGLLVAGKRMTAPIL